MKKLFYILLFLILVNSPLEAKILRVNNQLPTNAPLIFNTLQEAHNVAAAGDTLMVEGSPSAYANVIISKRLVIIGTGYFLDENLPTSSSQLLSLVKTIEFANGSAESILIGVVFDNALSSNRPIIKVNNILITRCFITNAISIQSPINGAIITQNYFSAIAISVPFSNVNFSNIVFKNNIVNGRFEPGQGINLVFSDVSNNVFLDRIEISTDTFRSNIIATNSTNISILSNNVTNNLTLGNQLTGNGNQLYNANQLFVGSVGNSTDGQYQIKADSPYLTAGHLGTQPGIFGGSTPYVLSGLPPIPSIYELVVDPFGSQNNGLNIKLKAKTNN